MEAVEAVVRAKDCVRVVIWSVACDETVAAIYNKSDLPCLFQEVVDALRLKTNGTHEFEYDCSGDPIEAFDGLLSIDRISTILRKTNGEELEEDEGEEDPTDYFLDNISDYVDAFCDDVRMKSGGETVTTVNGEIDFEIRILSE